MHGSKKTTLFILIILMVAMASCLLIFARSKNKKMDGSFDNNTTPVIEEPNKEKEDKEDTNVDSSQAQIEESTNIESKNAPTRKTKQKNNNLANNYVVDTHLVNNENATDNNGSNDNNENNVNNDNSNKKQNPVDIKATAKINSIRNTPNTDISSRNGKVFYISNAGNDNNNGLSEDKPIKTLSKLNTLINNNTVKSGDTVLFRDGDIFRGNIKIKNSDILLGSYGDISKGKPKLYKSLYDGAKEGNWVEVKKNIWKYQIADSDPFKNDVGTIWFFCDKGNNNCTKSIDSVDRKFNYATKILTDKTYDEEDIEDNIDTLLKNDLEFYHVGHATVKGTTGKTIYLYSTSNPSTRFDEIEFNAGSHVIYTENTPLSSLMIDNLYIAFAGGHGISIGNISNLKVTNCEIPFIGGGILQYDNSGKPTRYGNAIQIYGAVIPINGVAVTDGFVVDNCYIYQVYDTGVTFQYSTSNEMRVEKASFTNNVIDYTNWSIEYWNRTTSKDEKVINNSYIGDFYIGNNILRHAGSGVSETRSDLGTSAHIMTWQYTGLGFNRVKDKFIIENNIFDGVRDQNISIKSSLASHLPILKNNTFYGDLDTKLGHYYAEGEVPGVYTFGYAVDKGVFNNNSFVLKDTNNYKSLSGIFGTVIWKYDASSHMLSLTGNGAVPDFIEGAAPWYNVRNGIYRIYIGEGITSLGNYSFYNMTRVNTIELNANLDDFSWNSSDVNLGTNYIFYKVGHDDYGVDLIIGSNVKKIPKMFSQPSNVYTDAPAIRNIIFMGNSLKELRNLSITKYRNIAIKIPEGVEIMAAGSLANSDYLKTIILPSTLKEIRDWSFTNNIALEKLIVAGPISSFGGTSLFYNRKLTTIVVPHIDKPEVYSGYQFNYVSGPLTVYGDSSVEEWINNILNDSKNTKKDVIFKDISEYSSNISSNSDISGIAKFNGTFTFTTDKKVKAYYICGGNKFALVDLIKEGNTYTIENIVSDVYIEVE